MFGSMISSHACRQDYIPRYTVCLYSHHHLPTASIWSLQRFWISMDSRKILYLTSSRFFSRSEASDVTAVASGVISAWTCKWSDEHYSLRRTLPLWPWTYHDVPQLALHLDANPALLFLSLDGLALQLFRNVGRTTTHHRRAHDHRC